MSGWSWHRIDQVGSYLSIKLQTLLTIISMLEIKFRFLTDIWISFSALFRSRLISIIIFFAFCVAVNSIILDCSYSMQSARRLYNMYTCTGKIIFVGDLKTVSDVSHNHMANQSNSNVLNKKIWDKKIRGNWEPPRINLDKLKL